MNTNEYDDEHDLPKYPIVGIGASAGGLKALKKFFAEIPDAPGMSFIVVQHLSPNYESAVPEILSRYTVMPIVSLTENTQIQRNTIYLCPPATEVSFEEGWLLVEELEDRNALNLPIDKFFKSLGAEIKDCAVGVVLSGSGTDGSRGIHSIKENDGLILVQSPKDAEFDGMPISALRTGMADYEGSSPELAHKVMEIAKAMQEDGRDSCETDAHTTIKSILSHVEKHSEIPFKMYRERTLRSRITRRQRLMGFSSRHEYAEYLQQNRDEVQHLIESFFIGVTHFFRDPESWVFLKKHLRQKLQNMEMQDTEQHDFRVWVVGCSTGEEAYSIAMMYEELRREMPDLKPLRVIASDADPRAIELASQGIYSISASTEMAPDLLQRYFEESINNKVASFRAKEHLRDKIVFSTHDVLTAPPFTRMDLVICRNLLIYFRPQVQHRLLNSFHFALQPGGTLFLGSSESLGNAGELYSVVNRSARIFTAKEANGKTNKMALNTHWKIPRVLAETPPSPSAAVVRSRKNVDFSWFEQVLQESLGEAVFFVNQELQIFYVWGCVERYFGFPRYQMHLESCAPMSVTHRIQELIEQLMAEAENTVLQENLSFYRGTQLVNARLKIQQILSPYTGELLYQLRLSPLIEDAGELEFLGDDARLQTLQQELKVHQVQLNQTVQELESTNEELQSSNEELLSSNEELQSSNEELQAVNEELHTVNTELQEKIQQLTLANNDISNLLQHIRVGVIFVDQDFCIRRFTQASQDIFPINTRDIGRPIEHFNHQLLNLDLMPRLRQVFDELVPIEEEVQTLEDKSYLLRITPYKTLDNRIEGLVITLTDISALKQAESEILEQNKLFSTAFQHGVIPKMLCDHEGSILDANPAFEEYLGYRKEDLQKMKFSELQFEQENCAIELQKMLKEQAAVARFNCGIWSKRGELKQGELTARSVKAHQDKHIQYVVVQIIDTTARYAQELALERERLRLQKAETAAHLGSWEMELDTGKSIWSDEFYRICGYQPGEVEATAEQGFQIIHPDDRERAQRAVEQAIQTRGEYNIRKRIVRPNGEVRHIHSIGQIEANPAQPDQWLLIGAFIDITELVEAEQKLNVYTSSLEANNQDLEDFAFVASHDLQEPLRKIQTFSGRLRSAYGEQLDEKGQDYLQRLHNAAERLQKLVTALREYACLNSPEHGFQKSPLRTHLKRVLEQLSHHIEAHQVEIEYTDQLPEIEMIPEQIESLLKNILSNSIQYRDPERPLKIKITTELRDEKVCLSIEDNGLGFDNALSEQIMFPLRRLWAQEEIQGAGMGLAICAKIAARHQGEIKIQGRPEHGATVRLELPYAQTSPELVKV